MTFSLSFLNSDTYQVYNRHVARLCGSVNAAIMLSELIGGFQAFSKTGQLASHEKHGKGWFYLTVERCEERTCLSKVEQANGLKILKQMEFIEQVEFGLPCRRYFRLCEENILNALGFSKISSSKTETVQLDELKPSNHVDGNSPTAPIYKEPYDDLEKKKETEQFVSFSDPIDEKEKRELFADYGFSNDTIDFFMQFSLAHLKNAIMAFEQYNDLKNLSEPLGCLYKAITQGWKPNTTKKDREKATQMEKDELDRKIKENRTYAFRIKEEFKDLFNNKYDLIANDNYCILKRPQTQTPLGYAEDKFKEILESFIQLTKGKKGC